MGIREKRSDPEDDGRVIAPMNVEGMPWYTPQKKTSTGGSSTQEQLTPKEKRAFAWGVIKATMLVAVVFIGVFLGFILFCTEIWFK